MPNKREGSVEWRGGMWKAHIWIDGPPKRREWVPLDGVPRHDRALAKAAATEAQALVTTHGYVPCVRGLTVNEWTKERWLKLREKLWPTSWTNDESNYRVHIASHLGVLPMKAVTRDALREYVRNLDDRVLTGELARTTALNIWHTVTRMFTDATQSNEPGIAVLDTNPARDIEGPMAKGIEREKQLLYPDEFLQLVSCEQVPLSYARFYAISLYTYVRQAEQIALDWSSIDLRHGTIHVHESLDLMRGDGAETKATKTRSARRFAIEPELLPLLEVMKGESGGKGRLFPKPPILTGESGLAESLRRHLTLAGIERTELTVRLKTRMPIRFHDLRASGVTWRLARGDAAILVQQDAGHSCFQTTEKYIRSARGLPREDVFPPLPGRLIGESGSRPRAAKSPRTAQQPKKAYVLPGESVGAAGFEPATSSV